jgi:endonuclease YncB( thermonuclease family)
MNLIVVILWYWLRPVPAHFSRLFGPLQTRRTRLGGVDTPSEKIPGKKEAAGGSARAALQI